jgi:hypothetical protein
VAYLVGSAERSGVSLRTGASADADSILSLGPDFVVLADGARYPIPGMLHLLRLPGMRWVASLPPVRKLFFRLLRSRGDGLPRQLLARGVDLRVAGDRSGTRGVEAAILGGYQVGRDA